MAGMREKNPSFEMRREYRELLDKAPDLALVYGDLPRLARQTGSDDFEDFPMMQESVKVCLKHIRAELLGQESTPLERLLVECVVQTHQDYFSFAMIAGKHSGKSLGDIEKYERILASKEQRYLRAIAELARVRRLLKLPPLQVNVAIAGGQQLNVAGELPGSAKGGQNGGKNAPDSPLHGLFE
jgi:hypothetical protein